MVGRVGVPGGAGVQQAPELLPNGQSRTRRGADSLPAPKHSLLGCFPPAGPVVGMPQAAGLHAGGAEEGRGGEKHPDVRWRGTDSVEGHGKEG